MLSTTVALIATLLTFDARFTEEDDLISQKCDGPCATLEGKLTTYDGTVPLKEVQVVVTWVETFGGGVTIGGITRKKASVQTDEDGNYRLRFNIRADEMTAGHFDLEIMTPDDDFYFCNSGDHPIVYLFDLKNDTTISNNIYIPYKTSLKINASNAADVPRAESFWVDVIPTVGIGCGQTASFSNEDPNVVRTVDVPSNQDIVVRTGVNRGLGQGPEWRYDTLNIDRGSVGAFTATYWK